MSRRGGWPRYVPVAERKKRAKRKVEELRRSGRDVDPVKIEGRKITRNFWGTAWMEHLESYSDYANRLPRGRSYVRHGAVVDLQIESERIDAQVMGSRMYDVAVAITGLSQQSWAALKSDCRAEIDSLVALLGGELSESVIRRVTRRKDGLFPRKSEIEFACSCPDYASMCKHIAAVLYGVGARFDQKPQLLFVMRGVDHEELIHEASADSLLEVDDTEDDDELLEESGLGDLFGIELDDEEADAVEEQAAGTDETVDRVATEIPEIITRQELLEAGVPAGTIGNWRRTGKLESTDQRGIYRASREGRPWIRSYLEERGLELTDG